jgi:carboxylate-amine ligase
MSTPFTFGIEEEFFLVDPRTRSTAGHVPRDFLRECRRHFGEQIAPELLESQIEVASPVFSSCAEARSEMRRLRRDLIELAGQFGLKLLASGTHPLAAWTEQRHTAKPRYEQLVDDFQIVGRRNLVCGLHVHVAVPPGVDRIRLMNRTLRWLPLFLALSTSSPFWNRQRTGLRSYRQAAYDEWPRTGVPEIFGSEAEFEAYVARLVRAGVVRDASWFWWVIRPSARFPTLELRITDACPRLDDVLAIAALFRCLVRRLVREPETGADWHPQTRALIEENRWRAKRHGLAAQFLDEASEAVLPATLWLERLLAEVHPDAEALGCADSLARLPVIAREGTSADHQLARYGALRADGASRLEALRGVVDALLASTAADVADPIATAAACEPITRRARG